jgi:hypothetical protein
LRDFITLKDRKNGSSTGKLPEKMTHGERRKKKKKRKKRRKKKKVWRGEKEEKGKEQKK